MKIKNITFDALDKYALKYALTSPSDNQSGLYSIYADNCIFQNFKTKNGGSIFKAYSGTKADTLSFTNTRFEDSYRGLNLSYDKDVTFFVVPPSLKILIVNFINIRS